MTNPFDREENESGDGEDAFPKPDIPPNAPPELINLAENMNDIIQTLNKLKGPEYVVISVTLTTLLQQVAQLEKIACIATGICNAAAETQDQKDAATANHEMSHLLAEASTNAVGRLIGWFASTTAFKGIDSDIEMMMKRIKADWIDKGHG